MSIVSISTKARRGAIMSQQRAMAIVERVAVKHDLTVAVALCSKRDRYAVACRAEIATVLKGELGWSQERTGALLGVTRPAVGKLLGFHKVAERRARHSLPPVDLVAIASLDRDALKGRLVDAEAMIAYLQGELDRMTGASVTHQLAESFGLDSKLRCAIVLAILAEAYPRAVPSTDLTERYDDACARLNYGNCAGTSTNLVTKNIAALRDHFAELGYADPVVSSDGVNGKMRALSADAARLLNERVGVPRLSQLKTSLHSTSLPAHLATLEIPAPIFPMSKRRVSV